MRDDCDDVTLIQGGYRPLPPPTTPLLPPTNPSTPLPCYLSPITTIRYILFIIIIVPLYIVTSSQALQLSGIANEYGVTEV